jgi:hypothetical protein
VGRRIVGARDDDHLMGNLRLFIESGETTGKISRPTIRRHDD